MSGPSSPDALSGPTAIILAAIGACVALASVADLLTAATQ